MVAVVVMEEGEAGVGQNVSKDTCNTTRRRHLHSTAPCACLHAQSSSSRISCPSPHLRTTTSISSVPAIPSFPSHCPTAPHTRQSARTASKTGPQAAALREGSRALTPTSDVTALPHHMEKPPSTRPVAPMHAREAAAYLHIANSGTLASSKGGKQPSERAGLHLQAPPREGSYGHRRAGTSR